MSAMPRHEQMGLLRYSPDRPNGAALASPFTNKGTGIGLAGQPVDAGSLFAESRASTRWGNDEGKGA